MKPVSMLTSPSLVGTVWVSAWPPRRSSASSRVTAAEAETTWAAVRPATPLPITATRRIWSMVMAGSGRSLEVEQGYRLRGGGVRPSLRLDGDPDTGGVGGVALEQHRPASRLPYGAGGDHLPGAGLQPQLVDPARRRGRHVVGDQHRATLRHRAVDTGGDPAGQGHVDPLGVGGLEHPLGDRHGLVGGGVVLP